MSVTTDVIDGPERAGRLPRLRVGLVAATESWRADLQAYLEHHVAGVDVVVIRDPHLLLDDHLDLVLIDDAATVIGRTEIELLGEARIPVVGIFHTGGGGRGEGHLEDLGVARRLPADTDVTKIAKFIRSFDPVPDRNASTSDDSTALNGSGASEADRLDRLTDQVMSPARVVTIGGVSERRHELAALLASGYGRMHQSMVIDLDPFRPRLARRFRLQLQPNVLVACRSLSADFEPMHFTGRRTVSTVELPFWSLVGVPSPDDVTQLDTSDLVGVIEKMSLTWPRLVLVADGVVGNTAATTMRTAAMRTATSVVVAADPTPEGVLECLDWLVQTDSIDANRRVDVVFCGRPHERPRRVEIADQLREHRPEGTVRNVVFLPWKESHVIAASWEGRQVGRRSKMSRSARRLAQLLSTDSTKRLEVL